MTSSCTNSYNADSKIYCILLKKHSNTVYVDIKNMRNSFNDAVVLQLPVHKQILVTNLYDIYNLFEPYKS